MATALLALVVSSGAGATEEISADVTVDLAGVLVDDHEPVEDARSTRRQAPGRDATTARHATGTSSSATIDALFVPEPSVLLLQAAALAACGALRGRGASGRWRTW